MEWSMEKVIQNQEEFQPEVYCLVCQSMEWDGEKRRCANFDKPGCPLSIKRVLAGCEMNCLVI
jgi:hypothetical protein